MKILLATDGSAHCKEMVKEFARLTLDPNAKLRIISAYESTSHVMYIDPVGVSKGYYAEADKALQKKAEEAIKDAVAALVKREPKLSISAAAIKGPAKNVILEEAEKFNADLIVVGSHGHGAVAGFFLGSVSLAVALHAKCSVEIVRVPQIKSGRKGKK